MSFSKKRLGLTVVGIIAATVVLAYFSKNGTNPISKAVNYVFTPIQSKLSEVIVPVRKFTLFMGEMKELDAENRELKIRNSELETQLKSISEYKEENERLRKLLAITDEYNEYETVAARVISYEPDNWFSYITIDKGTSSGISVSDTVMTADGLVGQVVDAGENWAKVSTIINSESSAGVRIVRNGEIGIAEGDTALSKTYKCRLGYLTANASVIAGDILETSGLGGIYPPGLMVGKISDISKDNMGRLDYAIIEPFVNFNRLYEVMVITDWTVDIPNEEQNAVGNDVPVIDRNPPAEEASDNFQNAG